MNALTSQQVFRDAKREAYIASITVHCPNCDDMELAARCDLAAIRDAATVGVMRAGDSAAVILAEIARLATSAVYAQGPASRLIRIRAALNFTMEAARAIERVTQGVQS